MNIWDWVYKKYDELYENGHHRLAQIIDDISTFTVNGEHHKVDAILPEGLALARGLKDKWIEIFLRHWHLQSRVLHRYEVGKSVSEAISLLDFSHQEDTEKCPQSICVVQDLSVCYSYIDGPSYADERLKVAQETLDRIDPTWPCYSCISSEYASAIIDQGRYDDALAYFDQCNREQLKMGVELDQSDYALQRVQCLIESEKYTEARAQLENILRHYKGTTYDTDLKINRALVAAHQQKFEEAISLLPGFNLIENEVSSYQDWLNVKYILAINGAIENDWKLGLRFEYCVNRMASQGILRISIRVATFAFKLALARESLESARLMLCIIASLVPRLPKMLGADKDLRGLQAMLQTRLAAADKLPFRHYDTIEALIDDLSQDDPERALAQLYAQADNWQHEPSFCLALTQQLELLERVSEAIEYSREFLDKQPDSPDILLEHGHRLRIYLLHDEFVNFYNEFSRCALSEASLKNLHWLHAGFLLETDDLAGARNSLEYILKQEPDAYNTRIMLADIECRLENYDKSLFHLDFLISAGKSDDSLQWERITTATLMQNWAVAREAAAALGMDISNGTDEINEEWEYCRVQFEFEQGDMLNYLAQRTGPVTAQIIGVSDIEQPRQHYFDQVVFDPAPLNTLEHTDEDGNPVDAEGFNTYLYRLVKVMQPGGYTTYDLDGVHPGDETIEKISAALAQLGVVLRQRNGEDYELYHEESEKDYPGFYAYLLVSGQASLLALHASLTELSNGLVHPLVWRRLVADLGDSEMLNSQAIIAKAYAMSD